MLNAAVDDGIIVHNPANRLGKTLKLSGTRRQVGEEVRAMTAEQLDTFLRAADRVAPLYYPLLFTMARTGLRLGEAVALEWDDVDLAAREITVSRTFSGGKVGTPKSGKARSVDMSHALAELLHNMDVARKAEALEVGGEPASLVFPGQGGQRFDQSRISKVFKRTLKAAGLPLSLSPHSLRHTFAIMLIRNGAPLTYVRDMLGHSSITVTADTYARHLPTGDKALVDALDGKSGSSLVAVEAAGRKAVPPSPSRDWSRRSDLNRGPADYEKPSGSNSRRNRAVRWRPFGKRAPG
jgi:integrase